MKLLQLMSAIRGLALKSLKALPALAVLAGLTAVGCAQKSPLEQMVENRSRYEAELNSFFVDETPTVSDVMGDDAELEGEPAGEGEADEPLELDLEPEPVPVDQKIHLDILIRHDSFEKLPGVTVDITQVDSEMNPKGSWRLWLDTANVERANPTAYSHVLEDAEYAEGDAFSVEVRHPIPEAERAEYKEFEGLG